MWKRRGLRYATVTMCVIATAAGIWAVRAVWLAQGVLREARVNTAAESSLRFTSRPLDPSLPTGLEFVGAPAVFSDAQVFEGRLFIAGPSGLAEYENGALITRYRVGAELPPAPITALAVGLAGDSRAPELWIGTAGEGLVAFDGRVFRQIRAEDARFRKITALAVSETGRILIGTEKSGVLVYDGHELKPFHSSLAGAQVTALAGDDADLWVGTIDRGLLHWKAGALESMIDELPDKRVLSLAKSSENDDEAIYAGTGLGVAEIRDGKVARTLAPGYFAQSLLVADGKLWIGTLEEGMVSIPVRGSFGNHPARSAQSRASVCGECSIRKIFRVDGEVYALAEDSLWRGTEALIRRNDDAEYAGSGNAILADRNIAALSMDASGRLWIGFFDHGLQILHAADERSGSFASTSTERFNDDHLFCVNRIAHDAARGVSAVATANGLVMFDASLTRRRVITHDDGLIANQVTDVVLRPDGSAVAATPAGVSFIDASGISSIYAFHGLVNNHVYALATDGPRTLAGTLGGLSILDGPIVKASFTTANSTLKQNWITAIVRASGASNAPRPDAEWFIGTYGGGVLRMDSQGRWEAFEEMRGEIEINSNAMISSDRAVYAGTLDRGLAIFDVSSGRWHFWTRGLPSANVTAVEVRGGMVYVGTDNGLVKVPESTVVNP
jgi:ligand-binding sensor domain-containing protein